MAREVFLFGVASYAGCALFAGPMAGNGLAILTGLLALLWCLDELPTPKRTPAPDPSLVGQVVVMGPDGRWRRAEPGETGMRLWSESVVKVDPGWVGLDLRYLYGESRLQAPGKVELAPGRNLKAEVKNSWD